MATKILNYLKNNIISTIIGVFLFFYPSFDDLRKAAMNETIINGLNVVIDIIPNLITGGILVFLFLLYKNTLIKNDEQQKDIEMLRFINEYRMSHVMMTSLNWNGGMTPSFFTDSSIESGQLQFHYDANEKTAAKNFFIHTKGLLAKDAEKIIERYYKDNI